MAALFSDLAPRNAQTGAVRALTAGTRFGEFEITRVVIDSGFGVVYLASDHALQTSVAIKEYLPAALTQRGRDGVALELRSAGQADAFQRGRQAFIAEARLLARASHPSLLPVQRLWEGNGTVYRAMPWLRGVTLLAQRPTLPHAPDEAQVRALTDALLGALDAVHGQGVAHGHVTPGNILMLDDARPVLLGGDSVRRALLSERVLSLMSAVRAQGPDPSAVAPEEGPRGDLHALGKVLYFFVSGHMPAAFEPLLLSGDSAGDRPAGANPTLTYGSALLGAIDAALAADPNERPQDVAEFRALLARDNTLPEARMAAIAAVAAGAAQEADAGAAAFDVLPGDSALPAERPKDAEPGWIGGPTAWTPDAEAAGWPNAAPQSGSGHSSFADQRKSTPRWPLGLVLMLLLGALGAGAWTLYRQALNDRSLAMLASAARQQATQPAAAPEAVRQPDQAGAQDAATPDVALAAPPKPDIEPPASVATVSSGAAVAPAQTGVAGTTGSPAPHEAVLDAEPASPAAAPDGGTATAPPAPIERRATLAAPTRSSRAAAPPALPKRPRRAAAVVPSSPREACGGRTEFALYRCMQTECEQTKWIPHPQCIRLRRRDQVG